MSLSIDSWIHFTNNKAIRDGDAFVPGDYASIKEPQELYRLLSLNYMKFFKMDLLCKWAWLGAEALLNQHKKPLHNDVDKSKVAVVFMTSYGCIDVDKKYKATISDIPSPALFVYTLPNIMLGEICIRHGFKGEQLCLVDENFNAEELYFWVSDLLNNRGMDACICGWANAYDEHRDICMFWVTKGNEQQFSEEKLNELYYK